MRKPPRLAANPVEGGSASTLGGSPTTASDSDSRRGGSGGIGRPAYGAPRSGMCEPIAEHDMAGKITYIAPVDYGQGKIFGRKNKWIAVKRTFGNKQKGCCFQGERDMLNHPVTDDEQQARLTFKTIAKKVAARRKKSSPTYEQDSVAFLTQRDLPGGIQSFQKWLWEEEKGK